MPKREAEIQISKETYDEDRNPRESSPTEIPEEASAAVLSKRKYGV
jgi:hypothetical protein